jgi:putative phage-type endonuclease
MIQEDEITLSVSHTVSSGESQPQWDSRCQFPEDPWEDCGGYWRHRGEQGGDDWLRARKGRVTASNAGAAAELSSFTTPEALAEEINGTTVKEFDSAAKERMGHGTVTEPVARDWYSSSRGVTVREVGLAVPKWEPRLGGSLDGDVVGTEGMIEIKAPKRMYGPLLQHQARLATGWQPPVGYRAHIWPTHYAQMQLCMQITGKKWCDYIVYATESNLVYVERVPLSDTYWRELLAPRLAQFLDRYLPLSETEKETRPTGYHWP